MRIQPGLVTDLKVIVETRRSTDWRAIPPYRLPPLVLAELFCPARKTRKKILWSFTHAATSRKGRQALVNWTWLSGVRYRAEYAQDIWRHCAMLKK